MKLDWHGRNELSNMTEKQFNRMYVMYVKKIPVELLMELYVHSHLPNL